MSVVAIAAGMKHPKKGTEPFRLAHRYLNYGLLGLSSMVREYVPVLHGNFEEPQSFVARNEGLLAEAKAVLLSLPSFYAVSWASSLIKEAGLVNRHLAWHVGGRWVVDGNEQFLRAHLGEEVLLHEGLGDGPLRRIASLYGLSLRDVGRPGTSLDYARLLDREEFQPSVEVSRGCGLGCRFCSEAAVPLVPLKAPDAIVAEVSETLALYSSKRNFYFESSFFAPSQKWSSEFVKTYQESHSDFKWRTETRVDALSAAKLQQLASAGLRVLDLGLESASPRQLLAMGKTADPDRYLRNASSLLEACASSGVRAKVNVLLYAGETWRTIQETMDWLDGHRHLFAGVSVYPVLVFGVDETARYWERVYAEQGATGLVSTRTDGVWNVNLSSEVSAEDAMKIATMLSQRYMTAHEYFFLKKFSYLSSGYSWVDFQKDALAVEPNDRPFSLGSLGPLSALPEEHGLRESVSAGLL